MPAALLSRRLASRRLGSAMSLLHAPAMRATPSATGVIASRRLGCAMSSLPEPNTTAVPAVPSAAAPGPFGTADGGTVTGSVAPGYERFRDAFEANFARNWEDHAQLCIYHRGARVVDLSGHSGAENPHAYDAGTLQNIFSSGKNFEAIACLLLVDRGLLRYEDKISKHWPAFAQHGKDGITVEDLLRHEAGLQFFADPVTPDDFSKVRVPGIAEVSETKSGAVERLIEGSGCYGVGERMYHASTRGFVVGGLVRQMTGKTLGEFVHEEIAAPLKIEAFIGASLEEQSKHAYAPMKKCSGKWTLVREIFPALFGDGGDTDKGETLAMFKVIGRALMEKNSPLKGYAKAMPKEWEGGGGDHVHVSTPEGRLLEVSSGGVQSNARSLAKMGALLANGGTLDDVTLCSAASVDKAMGSPKRNRDNVWCMDLENSVGGFFDFGTMREIAGRPTPEGAARQKGFRGWAGKGGSLFLWNPDANMSIGYCMTGMMNGGSGGPRTDAFFESMQAVLHAE